MITRRSLLGSVTVASAATRAFAQTGKAADATIRIGVLGDESGVYRDVGGPGSLACVHQAVKEFNATNPMKVEVLVADHQNKPDIALGIARQWFDSGGRRADGSAGLRRRAGGQRAGARPRQGHDGLQCRTTEITGKSCTRNTVHWGYDSYMMAYAVGGALVRSGGDTCSSSVPITRPAAPCRTMPRASCSRLAQGARQHRDAVPERRFLLRHPAGTGLRRESCGARQCRQRFGKLREAGSGIWPDPGRDQACGPQHVHHQYPCVGPRDRARACGGQHVLLGPRRPTRAFSARVAARCRTAASRTCRRPRAIRPPGTI